MLKYKWIYYAINFDIFLQEAFMAKILVVDDSSIMRRNLSTILTEAGHNVVGEAANGESAYKEYERLQPDLVTMDITMPILDGIGAVKKILKYYPEANIIMISALDQKQMVLAAVQNGAKHYIIKPFAAEKVAAVVNEVLSSSEAAEKTQEKLNDKLDNTITEINSAIDDIDKTIDGLADEAPAEEAKEAKEADEKTSDLPFSIESRVNELRITLASDIKAENFQSLNMIIQGFLFIKSLTVIIDLGSSTDFTDDVIKKISELSRSVTGHSAKIKVRAENLQVLELLKSKNSFFASITELA
jgi:YesN/AraC family two-component response regulator